ncbi:MAG: 3-deoxy-D-manno-octulosonic acid transferase [Burkholderiales bacterium]|nr:3-deoxy-D-manno-octulosonic acid transferase [Burkholderiales bacterium]
MIWRLLYGAALYAALPALFARLLWRARREPGYRERIGERLGYYRDREVSPSGRPLVWVHAVSVGEARASAALVRALAAGEPRCELLLTCTTAAGRTTLADLHGQAARIVWLPWDTPGAVRRFLAHFRPTLGVLVETEVWPNLVVACRARGVPLVLANARLSERSARRYARVSGLARPAFAAFAAVCAQSEADAARLRAVGATAVEVTGNLKFDATPDEAKRAEAAAFRAALGARQVLLFASTREGEEAMLFDALGAPPAEVLVVVVPRHPARADDVERLLAARGLRIARRSRGDAVEAQALVGDTLGEMDFYYAAADVALIGGSFAPLGGQNLIEALAAGTPAVLGPHMFNFAEATRLALEAGAALQACDAKAALAEAMRLLADPARRRAMGEAGRRLCAAHRGATARHLARIRALLAARECATG